MVISATVHTRLNMKRVIPIVWALLLFSGPAFAQVPPNSAQTVPVAKNPPAGPVDGTFAPDRLARIDRLLQQYVDQNRIAGAVALVLHDGTPVYERAVGWGDKEAGRRMTTSTVFRIASQTKAITSTAILALVEEGKIGLNEPVSHFIPTFAKTTVAVKTDSGITTVPAKRAITIQDLLTHTAGISYGTDSHVAALYEAKGLGPSAGNGWYTADKDEQICDTMDAFQRVQQAARPAWLCPQ
jgi:CubicO group peptidase (beta-lactamase class C family)